MRILVVGGSDAGISAALRARECAPDSAVTMLVADAYPNFSICGVPYHLSGEVPDWRDLAHRTAADIEATGIDVRINHTATAINSARRVVTVNGALELDHDRLIIGTGAEPLRPPVGGLDTLGPADGVHLLHTMDEARRLDDDLRRRDARQVVIIGAGYIGIEMAEALTTRGIGVTVLERLDGVLPRTLDRQLADEITAELETHGVEVRCGTTVTEVRRDAGELTVVADDAKWTADAVLVVSGVRPNTELAAAAGVQLNDHGTIIVDRQMRTNLPDVWAAGDCVHTHHVLLAGPAYLPLGTTAHKQGRVAGENAAGGAKEFAGIVGTQVVRVFDRVVAATGLRDSEATAAGYAPLTVQSTADDHKRYYPGATPIHIRLTGDRDSGRLLGAQLVGTHGAEIAKRVDTYAVALQTGRTVEQLLDLDLAYTPPLGSPWDAIQLAAQHWLAAR
ncbi:FAD-dependent oxidoreductase [Kribbella sp. NPDC002412]